MKLNELWLSQGDKMYLKNFSALVVGFSSLAVICPSSFAQVSTKPETKVEIKTTTETLQESVEKSLRNALLENEKLSADNTALKSKFTELENYARTISVMNNMLRNDNQRLTTQVGELADTKARISDVENQLQSLTVSNKEMQNKIKEDAVTMIQLREDNQLLRTSLDNNVLEKENRVYKSRAEDAESKLELAIDKMSQAIKERQRLTQETSLLHYNLGYMFFQDRNFKRAADEFKRSVDLDPNNSAAYYNLGIIYDDFLGDNKLAILYYKKYLDALPEKLSQAENEAKNKVVAKMLQADFREKVRINSPIDDTLR